MMHTVTRRQTLGFAVAFAALAAFPRMLLAQGTREVTEMTLGSPDAPVTLVEYAMFTCPHCAAFHEDVFPQIKQNYIDTGKVRLIYREVYFNKPSLWAAMIARCAGPDRYFGVADILFSKQKSWLSSEDPEVLVQNLYAIGRQAGLSDGDMDACMSDGAFAKALVEEFKKNATADGIDSTPSFMIDGEKVGNLPYDEFAARLDAALAS